MPDDQSMGASPSSGESTVRVFISHAHRDRDSAALLDQVLTKHGAGTFLDQAHIDPGDHLPNRLREGITWCNRFLLIWSADAARSRWVEQEWNLAYDARKKIIPYRLDGSPLPDALDNLVYVDGDDRTRGDGNLLKAVFGREFTPADPSQIFPGHWVARLAVAGLGEMTYELDLRANGQIVGTARMGRSGPLEAIAAGHGLGHLLDLQGRVRGGWSYDDTARTLTLDITVELLGQSQREVLRISATGRNTDGLQGLDAIGRPWIVRQIRSDAGGSYRSAITAPQTRKRPRPARPAQRDATVVAAIAERVVLLGQPGHGRTTVAAAIRQLQRGERDRSYEPVVLSPSNEAFEQARGAILVVAADDGPMPQTREQLARARDAGISALVGFVNKLDVASDREAVDLVELEIRELANVYGYPGDRLPIIRGCARLAIENSTDRSAIRDLLGALDAAVPGRPS